MASVIEWYQEVERRGLTNKLSQEQQAWWNEVKRRGLAGDSAAKPANEVQPQEQTEPKTETITEEQPTVKSPGVLKGFTRSIAQEASFGAAPYIAESTNIQARKFGDVVAGIIDGNMSQIGRGLLPSSEDIEQYRKEGRREFVEGQKAFEKEHPKLAAVGKTIGNVAAIVETLPIGGGLGSVVAKGGAKATTVSAKLGAPKIATKILEETLPRATASTGAFTTYEGLKGLINNGEGLNWREGGKGAIKGSLEGLAFYLLGGGVAMAEAPLLQKASQMLGFGGKAVRGGIRTAAAAVEGAAVATAASAIEKGLGEERPLLPSKGEVLTGALGIGGIRAFGGLVQGGAKLVNQLKQPTTRENAANTINSINKTISRLEVKIKEIGEPRTETQAANKANYEKQIKELKEELSPVVKSYQDDIARIAESEGWTPVKDSNIAKTKTGYSPFEKNGKTVEFRVSNHRAQTRDGVITVDMTKPYDENLLNIKNTLRHLDTLESGAKFPKKIGEYPIVKENISPTEGQVNELKAQAQKKTGGELGDAMASAISKQRNIDVAFKKAQEAGRRLLPLSEKLRRLTGKVLRKGGEIIDTYIPLERTTQNVERLPGGKEVPMSQRSSYLIRQRDRGGRVAVRQRALVDDFEKETKADSLFAEKLQQYMVAKKNEEMLPGVIKRLEKGNKNGVNDKLISDKKRTLEEARTLVNEAESLHKNVVEHAKKQWDYAQEQLDELLESGRISKEVYNQWKQRTHYVHSVAKLPEDDLPRLFSELEEETINRQSGIADALKRYSGYEGGYENLALGNLVQGKRIAYFADTQKAMKSWLKDAVKTGEAIKLDPGEYFKAGSNPVIKRDSQIISWNNGVPEVYEVPKNVAKIFNPVMKEEGFLLRNLRLTNNVFKAGTTGISTGFSAMNLIRDFQSVIGGSRSGMYFRPAYLKTSAELYSPNAEKNLTPAQKQLRDLIDEGLGTEYSLAQTQMDLDRSELNRLNTMLEAQGQANPQGTFIGDIMALLMKGASFAKAPAEKSFQKIANGLSFLGNYSEKIGRATVFQTELRRLAGSEKRYEYWMQEPKARIPKNDLAKAQREMNEVTLDFQRKMHPVIESLNRYAFPYFKPSILGAERVWKVLTDPEIAPQAWRWIATIGVLQGLVRAEMDPKQKAKYISQFNPEISAKSVSFMNKDGVIATIPASQEFGGLYQWIAAGAEWAVNQLKGREQREGVRDEVIAAAKQLGENAIPGVGYLFTPSNLVPSPVGKMIVEESINKDLYSKTDIESAAMQRLPVEERYSPSTPRVYRLMSKYLKLGKYQSSPKMWEHRAKKLGSSFAKEMADVADVAMELAGIGEEEWGLPKRIEDSAIVGRFFNKDYTAYARNVQEYDKEKSELEQAYNSWKRNPNAATSEIKEKAGIYNGIRKAESTRLEWIGQNQKLLSQLRRNGYAEWQKYNDGKITKTQFEKTKEIESANTAKKYYENQKKISDATDKILKAIRKAKKQKGIK